LVSFMPRPLYPGVTDHGTDWIRECVGPKGGLDTAAAKEDEMFVNTEKGK